MLNENAHPSDEELLLVADGELSAGGAKAIHTHLRACWHCRARMAELEAAIVEFARAHQETLDGELPPIEQARGKLRARLSEVAGKSNGSAIRSVLPFGWFRSGHYSMASVCVGLLAATVFIALLIRQPLRSIWPGGLSLAVGSAGEDGIEPNPKLTPGAIREVSLGAMCAAPHEEVEVDVPEGLREKILDEYGISEKHKGEYEIDFLIAPLLGGTEDAKNLWPEPYAPPMWNARVKDDLEERLHELVCSGKVDLKTAQNDIAADWIGAYKKYFKADKPVSLSSRASAEWTARARLGKRAWIRPPAGTDRAELPRRELSNI